MLLPSQKILFAQHDAITELFAESGMLSKIKNRTVKQDNRFEELNSEIMTALFHYGHGVYLDTEKQMRKLFKEEQSKMN